MTWVALGTVADVAPLRGENRTLVWHGLRALAQSRSPGIRALLDAGGGGALRVPLDDPAYGDKLERLRAVGAWLTTPLGLARALYA